MMADCWLPYVEKIITSDDEDIYTFGSFGVERWMLGG